MTINFIALQVILAFVLLILKNSKAFADEEKVVIISTGGTIVSVNESCGAIPDEKKAMNLICICKTVLSRKNFSVEPRFALGSVGKDSSDFSPEDWHNITEIIIDSSKNGIKKFLILHGTDTMAYTAAFLALTVPQNATVVLTGSQRLPDSKDFDGINNIKFASETLCAKANGVYIAFNGKVFDGAFVHKTNALSLDAFASTTSLIKTAKIEPISISMSHNWENIAKNIKLLSLFPAFCCDIEYGKIIIISGFGCGNMPQRIKNKFVEKFGVLSHDKRPIIIASSSCEFGEKNPDLYGYVGISQLARNNFTVFNQKNYSQEFLIVLSYLALLSSPDEPEKILELYLEKF